MRFVKISIFIVLSTISTLASANLITVEYVGADQWSEEYPTVLVSGHFTLDTLKISNQSIQFSCEYDTYPYNPCPGVEYWSGQIEVTDFRSSYTGYSDLILPHTTVGFSFKGFAEQNWFIPLAGNESPFAGMSMFFHAPPISEAEFLSSRDPVSEFLLPELPGIGGDYRSFFAFGLGSSPLTVRVAAVPEPPTVSLLGLSLAGLLLTRCRAARQGRKAKVL
ncbi:MAG: PEP-CTERM sorting domain-containing protein [Gammaproteobacteria bacterium]